MSTIQNTLRMPTYIILCSCHKLIFQNSMKNSLPMESSWWAEFRYLFRMSKIVISMQAPYTNFQKNFMTNSLSLEASWSAEFRKFSECRRVLFLIICHILILFDIMNNPFYFGIRSVMKFRKRFRISKFITFIQPPYINFLKYYENPLPLKAS